MLTSTLFLSLYIAIAGANPLVSNPSNGVSYQGTSSNGVEEFQNIFFAKPPTGHRRFTPPEAYTPPKNTIVNATVPSAACPQPVDPFPEINLFSNVTNMSEDCLSLRIARPANTSANANLPVMVWIYGGQCGETIGQISDALYTPTGLVLQAAGNGMPVIYVAVNYRVNIFGFASSTTLKNQKSLNNGLRDQRLGIQWVKDNIKAFGGDPDNITIFGESAGAISIGLQLTAFGGKQGAPFNKAIMQSGGPTTQKGTASNISAVHYAAVAEMTNCTRGDAGSQQTLDCLRDLKLETLLNASLTHALAASPPFGFGVYIMAVDDDFIPSAPSTLVQTGQFVKNTSVIVGWATNDGSLFTDPSLSNDSAVAAFLHSDFPGISNKSVSTLMSLYPVSDFEGEVQPNDTVTAQYYRGSRLWRDLNFVCGGVDISYQVSKYNSPSAHTYLYELNQSVLEPLFAAAGAPFFGVSHLSDIPYVFNEVSAFNASESDLQLGTEISGSWAAFAHTGNPVPTGTGVNATLLKDWPIAYPKAEGQAKQPAAATVNVIGGPSPGPANLTMNSTEGGALGMERLLERCAFINSIYGELKV